MLSYRRDLNYRVRNLIISNIPSFEIRSASQAAEGVREAFEKSGLPIRGSRLLSSSRLSAAAEKAEVWFQKGIGVVFRKSLKPCNEDAHYSSPVLFYRGDASFIHKQSAAILNSRGKKTVSPGDEWLRATKAAFAYALEKELALVSGYGNIQYSVVCALASAGPLLVVCHETLPFMAHCSTRTELASFPKDFLNARGIMFLSAYPPGSLPDLNKRHIERDWLVAALASVILVGRVRTGGNMERILREAQARGKKIIDFSAEVGNVADCAVKTERRKWVPDCPARFDETKGNMLELDQIARDSRFLIHYTRSFPGPWPGQNTLDYCLSLVRGDRESEHSAFDTLMRIIRERRIRAGYKLTRGKYPVVSFTECLPAEVRNLTEWRPGLIRWSFEPYGVAFPLQLLFRLGALPVIYAVKEAYVDLADELRHLFQLQAGHGRAWSPEKEWRIKGDFEITSSLEQEMVIIVKTVEEAFEVWTKFRIRSALAGV